MVTGNDIIKYIFSNWLEIMSPQVVNTCNMRAVAIVCLFTKIISVITIYLKLSNSQK